MRAPRHRYDEGGVLLIVLIIFILAAVAAIAVAQLAFTGPKAASALSGRERIANALDLGLSAEIENMRRTATVTCGPGTPKPDLDGLAGPIDVAVSCAGTTGPFDLVATAYRVQPACANSTDPVSVAPVLRASVEFTTQGSLRIARILTRLLDSSGSTCLPP